MAVGDGAAEGGVGALGLGSDWASWPAGIVADQAYRPHPGHYYDEGPYDGPYYYPSDYRGDPRAICAQNFRSFDWRTGYYTTYSGERRLCPYLREAALAPDAPPYPYVEGRRPPPGADPYSEQTPPPPGEHVRLAQRPMELRHRKPQTLMPMLDGRRRTTGHRQPARSPITTGTTSTGAGPLWQCTGR